MPRYARINYPGGIYHLISRCVGKQYLIKGTAEREKYLELLGRGATKTDTIILAYCMMSSHVHLVVRSGKDPLWRLMKSVNSGFAVWLNNRMRGKRDGAVFSQRYKSILVDEEAYLLALVRYVHNNPVRARLAGRASDSAWSSHRSYVGIDETPNWLNSGYVLSMINRKAGWARRQFDRFIDEGKGEIRRKDLSGEEVPNNAKQFQQEYGDAWRISGPILGSDRFAARVLEDLAQIDAQSSESVKINAAVPTTRPTLDEVIAVVCSYVGVEPWEFDNQPRRKKCALARKIIVYLWVNDFKGIQSDVARKLKASSPGVSKWFSNAVTALPELEPVLDEIRKQFPSFLHGAKTGLRTRVLFEYE